MKNITIISFFMMLTTILLVKGGLDTKTNSGFSLFLSGVEALAQDEAWVGKKLKLTTCKCSNGDKGRTFKCASNGDLENCTAIQQGLKGCYEFDNTLVMLCETASSIN